MKKVFALSLQVITLLAGIAALVILVRFPMLEGRAKNLDLVEIYTDPFILGAYAVSIAFFIALFNTFALLGFVRQDQLVSIKSVNALGVIKHCAIVLSVSIVLAAFYVRIFHSEDDDPAGFIALSAVFALVFVSVAAIAGIWQKRLRIEVDKNNESICLFR